MAKEWIARQFPTDDPETFIETLERCILGEFGPADGDEGATLDELIEHAKLTPAFRGCLLDVCEREFSLPWPECDRPATREHKVLVGLLALALRVPLEGIWGAVSCWFDRHAHMFEESSAGLHLGWMVLGVLASLDPGPSQENRSWWLKYETTESWAQIVLELFPNPPEKHGS